MEDAMVTGRMPLCKKEAGNAVLRGAGMNASQAINRLYGRLIEDGSAGFLDAPDSSPADAQARWQAAASFVDGLTVSLDPQFAAMTDSEAKLSRLRARGLV